MESIYSCSDCLCVGTLYWGSTECRTFLHYIRTKLIRQQAFRTQLSPEHVDQLIFLNKNMEAIYVYVLYVMVKNLFCVLAVS